MNVTRTVQSARLPVYVDAAHTLISLKVNFVELAAYGELDFVASASDIEAHGRSIFQRAQAGEFGAVAPYVAP